MLVIAYLYEFFLTALKIVPYFQVKIFRKSMYYSLWHASVNFTFDKGIELSSRVQQ